MVRVERWVLFSLREGECRLLQVVQVSMGGFLQNQFSNYELRITNYELFSWSLRLKFAVY